VGNYKSDYKSAQLPRVGEFFGEINILCCTKLTIKKVEYKQCFRGSRVWLLFGIRLILVESVIFKRFRIITDFVRYVITYKYIYIYYTIII